MSLLEELAQNGVSAEDLEKAASVRLFEKVATDEGIDLNELDDSQIDELFAHFVTNVLPALEGDQFENETYISDDASDAEKAASVLLFQKQADAEGIDLGDYSEEELEHLYGHFLENVLPNMFESHEEEKQAAAEVEEAQAKLAEMEILGRHMARAFHDESEKMASAGQAVRNWGQAAGYMAGQAGRKALEHKGKVLGGAALLTGGGIAAKKMMDRRKANAAKEASAAVEVLEELGLDVDYDAVNEAIKEASAGQAVRNWGQAAGYMAGQAGRKAMEHKGKLLGAAGLTAAGVAGKRMYDKRKASKEAAAFDELAEMRAYEILEANGVKVASDEDDFDNVVTARAIEMLEAAGYEFE